MVLDRADVDEPVQKQERLAFYGQSASDYSRQHVGNVYNNYAYTYTIRKRRSDETLQENQRNKQLLKAAAAGHTPRVRHLLELGADIDYSDDEDGFTALHHAAFSGFADTVELLLNWGADVAAQALDRGTPLHVAALKGRCNVVDLLLTFRADPDVASHAVGRPLHCACAAGDLDSVTALLARHSSVNIDARVDFTLVNLTPDPESHHWTMGSWECQPLFVAIAMGSRHVVSPLLGAGASTDSLARMRPRVNQLDVLRDKALPAEPPIASQSGFSPLLASVLNNMADTTRLLLEQGAFREVEMAMVTEAAAKGFDGCLGLLLEHLPSANVEDGVNGTPLMSTVRNGHFQTAQMLLDVGASINFLTSPEFGSSALHTAVIFERPGMVDKLLAWGAGPNLKDANSQSAADLARARRDLRPQISISLRHQICKMLEEHNASLRVRGQQATAGAADDGGEISSRSMTSCTPTPIARDRSAEGKHQSLESHRTTTAITNVYSGSEERGMSLSPTQQVTNMSQRPISSLPQNSTLPEAPRLPKIKGLFHDGTWYCACESRPPAKISRWSGHFRDGEPQIYFHCANDTKQCGFFLWDNHADSLEETKMLQHLMVRDEDQQTSRADRSTNAQVQTTEPRKPIAYRVGVRQRSVGHDDGVYISSHLMFGSRALRMQTIKPDVIVSKAVITRLHFRRIRKEQCLVQLEQDFKPFLDLAFQNAPAMEEFVRQLRRQCKRLDHAIEYRYRPDLPPPPDRAGRAGAPPLLAHSAPPAAQPEVKSQQTPSSPARLASVGDHGTELAMRMNAGTFKSDRRRWRAARARRGAELSSKGGRPKVEFE